MTEDNHQRKEITVKESRKRVYPYYKYKYEYKEMKKHNIYK